VALSCNAFLIQCGNEWLLSEAAEETFALHRLHAGVEFNATNLYGQIPQELPSTGTVPTMISPCKL
jgi:hypothetical protein